MTKLVGIGQLEARTAFFRSRFGNGCRITKPLEIGQSKDKTIKNKTIRGKTIENRTIRGQKHWK